MTGREITFITRSLAERYRIERELGAGGMATVYLAEDVNVCDRCATARRRRPYTARLPRSRSTSQT